MTEHARSRPWLDGGEAFQLLIDNVRDYALFMMTPDGTIVSWNVGVERVLGYPEAEFIGQPFSILFPSEDVASGRHAVELEQASRSGRSEDERWHLRRSGALFWASGVVTALRAPDGELRGFVKIMRDMTAAKLAEEERKQLLLREQQARQEAERATRVREYFLATLSHELRTPLNAIVGWTRMLRTRQLDAETVSRGLATIERNAQLQTKLISDLLDLPDLLSGSVRLEARVVELSTLVQQVIGSLEPEARARSLHLVVSRAPGSSGRVMGDAERLQQVIWNLVANGLKFTPSGGAVVVEIGSEADFATLTVSDDGPGIVAAELPRIFDPFYQVDTGSTRRHGGMGLGLAIVKHLVEQHHGSVSAESLGPNRGTTFTVRLPLEMGAAAATAERPPVATASLAGVRLVVIDDGPDSRARVASALSFAGAITREAGSSREGLWLVSTFRPHVIVCDLGMPDEDGFELITRLRELNDEDGGRTPALALTAHGSPADQLRALTAGYQMHLAKPVEVDTLINAVIQVIGLGR